MLFCASSHFSIWLDFNGSHQRLHHNGEWIGLNRSGQTSLMKNKQTKSKKQPLSMSPQVTLPSPLPTHPHTGTRTHTCSNRKKNQLCFSFRCSSSRITNLIVCVCMCYLNLMMFCTYRCAKRLRISVYMFPWKKAYFLLQLWGFFLATRDYGPLHTLRNLTIPLRPFHLFQLFIMVLEGAGDDESKSQSPGPSPMTK